MIKKKFYVTTPIYYVNGPPHLGGAYTTIAADVLARWHRMKGEDVFFLTGTDEHGQKIQEAAESRGMKPKEFVDKIAGQWKSVFKMLNISNDHFIRTTDPEHEEEVKKLLQELYDKDLIYKGKYESYYCVGCEQYLNATDLVEGKCPLHNTVPELKKEEAYLLRLSKFQDDLLKLIKSGKFCILPEERRSEIIKFIESGLKDVSISRLKEKIYWGIELPFDSNHCVWVWPDAFWNYVSGLKAKGVFKKFWPPDVQLMAKDIIRVHTTIWPALLMGTKNKLPEKLFAHGYFTVGGQKMSKSLGNVIDPVEFVNKYGPDSVRYFLMRNIPFGRDGDVSEQVLIERHNNELANDLGNLVNRVLVMTEKYFERKVPDKAFDKDIENLAKKAYEDAEKNINEFKFNDALNDIWKFIAESNKYINEKKPWMIKDRKELSKIIYTLLESVRVLAILVEPFMPDASKKILNQLGTDEKFDFSDIKFGKLKPGSKTKRGKFIFEKIEISEDKKEALPVKKSEEEANNLITIDDFSKIELKVAEIKEAEEIQGSDKLIKLKISLGKEERQIVAGIKKHYKINELIGKQIVIVSNLQPAKLKGIESNGMLLAAEDEKGNVSLITVDKKIENGSKIK